MRHDDAVVLVPGLFGFDSFGDGEERVSYFDRVVDQLAKRTEIRRNRFVVHKPAPTGPLWVRVASLYQKVLEIRSSPPDGRPVDRVHLLGHSTGGVDIRLLTNTKYLWPNGPTGQGRAAFLAKVGSVIPMSAPLRGTPIARRLRGAMEFAIPDLFLVSILAKRQGHAKIPEQMLLLYTSVLHTLSGGSAKKGALRLLGGLPPETAKQVEAFLNDIVEDHPLIHDLTPLAMDRLNEEIEGGDFSPIDCFVTVAPSPGVWDGIVAGLGIPKLQWAIYAFAYWATHPDAEERLPFPSGAWVGDETARAELISDTASDGVVPAGAQTLDGKAAGIVAGDHLDVVGHFESPTYQGTTVFKSGADFDERRFEALWDAVAAILRREDARTSPPQ